MGMQQTLKVMLGVGAEYGGKDQPGAEQCNECPQRRHRQQAIGQRIWEEARKQRDLRSIAEPAHGFDNFGKQLFAQPPDKDFNRVGVLVEILIIEVFDQLGA